MMKEMEKQLMFLESKTKMLTRQLDEQQEQKELNIALREKEIAALERHLREELESRKSESKIQRLAEEEDGKLPAELQRQLRVMESFLRRREIREVLTKRFEKSKKK